MNDIEYIEKPEWVSWQEVQKCIHLSHQSNKKNGFMMLNADISPEELKEDLNDGRCFVALKGKQVVGVACLKFIKNEWRKWWTRELVSYHCYDGILPEFRGTDVYLGLKRIRDNYDKLHGIKVVQFHTAENNKTVIRINEKMGAKRVQYAPTAKGAKYYSVTLAKWLDGCPYPNWFVRFMYNLSKFISRTFFTPEFKLRFWFH